MKSPALRLLGHNSGAVAADPPWPSRLVSDTAGHQDFSYSVAAIIAIECTTILNKVRYVGRNTLDTRWRPLHSKAFTEILS